MQNLKPYIPLLIGIWFFATAVIAAPYYTYQPTLLPETNNGYDLGTSTDEWRNAYFNNVTIAGTCTGSGCGSGGGGGGSTVSTVFSTTTTRIWIDSNRTDSYTPDGSIVRPYKSIGAAIQNFPATYEIEAGTYIEGNLTFTATSTLDGNQASIFVFSGAPFASPPGNITFKTGFSGTNLNILTGNLYMTDPAVVDPDVLQNSFVNGNVYGYGLFTMNGGELEGGTLYAGANSISNVAGVDILDQVQTAGAQFNLNDDNLAPTVANGYALVSSTTGASIDLNGVSLQNTGTNGGGISCANGATTISNNISNVSFVLATTSNAGVVNCGTANTSLGVYSAFSTINGQRLYATVSALTPFSFAGLNVEGQTLLGVNGGNVGINATSSPSAWLSIAGSAAGTQPLWMLSTSTAAFATSTAEKVDSNGNLSLSSGADLTLAPGSLLGIGTSSPYGPLAVMIGDDFGSDAPSVAFAVGSSTAGTATSTLLLLNSSGNATLLGDLLAGAGTAALPGIAVGNSGYGIWNNGTNLSFSEAGVNRFNLSATNFQSNTTGGPAITTAAPSGTSPSLVPNKSDLTTGIGSSAAGTLNLIAGGTNVVTINSGVGVTTANLTVNTSASLSGTTLSGTTIIGNFKGGTSAGASMNIYATSNGSPTTANIQEGVGAADPNSLLNFLPAGIGLGTTTPINSFEMYTSATTTETIDSGAATKGGCILLKDDDGSGYTAIFGNNGTTFTKAETTDACS